MTNMMWFLSAGDSKPHAICT